MRIETKIAVSIVLVIFISTGLKLFLPTPDNDALNEKTYWTKKTTTLSKFDIVIGGDSRVYRGVSPQAINEELGSNYSIGNFGYPNAGYSNFYLKYLISKFNTESKNKILLLGITPLSLTSGSLENEALMQYLRKAKFDNFKTINFNSFYSFFSVYVPVTVIKGLLNKNETNVGIGKLSQKFYDNGWVKSRQFPYDSTNALDNYKKVFESNQFDTTLFQAINANLKDIVESGIKVYAFRPPVTPQMLALEESRCHFNEDYVVKKLQESGVNWIPAGSSGYVSYDGSHLQDSSAIRFSRYLASQLKE